MQHVWKGVSAASPAGPGGFDTTFRGLLNHQDRRGSLRSHPSKHKTWFWDRLYVARGLSAILYDFHGFAAGG